MTTDPTPVLALFLGPIGAPEMIFIFVLALLIFGPKKLPELGKSFGKGMAEFKRASNELKYTFQREMDNIERENQAAKSAVSEAKKEIDTAYYDDEEQEYDSPASGGEKGSSSSADNSTSSSKETATPSNGGGTAPSPAVKKDPKPSEATTSAGASEKETA